MARKLTDQITGNWSYCSDERYEKLRVKFGSIAKLETGYLSREGAKFLAKHEGDVEAAKADARSNVDSPKNKIACIVTGCLCYISDERMKHLQEKYKTNEAGIRKQYISRISKRVREVLSQEQHKKLFSDLTPVEQNAIDEIIVARHIAGKLPAPARPKGSPAPIVIKVSKPRAPKAVKPAIEIKDTVPTGTGISTKVTA